MLSKYAIKMGQMLVGDTCLFKNKIILHTIWKWEKKILSSMTLNKKIKSWNMKEANNEIF